MLLGRQISAARALLKMSQKELAESANISIPTLKRMEASDGEVVGLTNNVLAVEAVLRKNGITFLEAGDKATGPGVSLDPQARFPELPD